MAMMEEAVYIGSSPSMQRTVGNRPQWAVDRLRIELGSAPAKEGGIRDLIFLRCPDRGYWLQSALEGGYCVCATHPLGSGDALQKWPLHDGHFSLYYEYASPHVDLQKVFDQIGGVLYFEVRCCASDPLALQQALLETIDWVRLQMESIDEVFARTRNLAGTSDQADCTVAYLKLVNGIEGHWFFHALDRDPLYSVTFYGRSGVYRWDGDMGENGEIRAESPAGIAATYRVADWIEKASRFERSMAYGEIKKR